MSWDFSIGTYSGVPVLVRLSWEAVRLIRRKKKIPAYLKQLNCFDNLKWTDFLEFPDLLCSVVIFAVVFCLELNVKNVMFKIMCLKGKNNGFQGRSGACRTHLIKKNVNGFYFRIKIIVSPVMWSQISESCPICKKRRAFIYTFHFSRMIYKRPVFFYRAHFDMSE